MGQAQNLRNVQVIPDGSGEFTDKVGMLVRKDNLELAPAARRYAAIIDNGTVEAWFEEPGRMDDCPEDPYGASSPESVLTWLRANPVKAAA